MNGHDADGAHPRDRNLLSFNVFDKVVDVVVSHRIESISELNELFESVLIPFRAFICNPIGKVSQRLPKTEIRKLQSNEG